ncbi:hypothetical protein QNH10_19310 [Sporosarcina thermotolerans]|nr:hypothetical protein [Sporosarcina thermotolerans]WHT48145.1 hypothetical protein QNH10_19310 [Sporosarcina thermotolerans]
MLDGVKFMEYLVGLQLTPSEKAVAALRNAYNSLSDLIKFQEKESKKKFYEGMAEIIYPAVKQDEKVLLEFNKFVHEDKGFFGHAKLIIEKKKENPKKYFNPHTFYIGDRLRSLSYRKHYELNEQLSLRKRQGDRYKSPSLHGHIQFFGEYYFLLNYCIMRDDFFTHIDVSRKEEFIQKLFSTGKTLIQNFNMLEEQERIAREKMGKTVGEQLQALDSTSETTMEANYNLVTADDILEALIVNLPYQLSDNIELEDVEFVSGQRYFISKAHPQTLTFLSDEGNYSVSVFVKDINNSYHVFTVDEEEGLAPEVLMETFDGTLDFTNFFSQLINLYELPSVGNDEADEDDGVIISTINDVLKVLERLID